MVFKNALYGADLKTFDKVPTIICTNVLCILLQAKMFGLSKFMLIHFFPTLSTVKKSAGEFFISIYIRILKTFF
jgi:hypothetical protein